MNARRRFIRVRNYLPPRAAVENLLLAVMLVVVTVLIFAMVT